MNRPQLNYSNFPELQGAFSATSAVATVQWLPPALTCSLQAAMQRQHTVLQAQQTKQRLSSSTGTRHLLALSRAQLWPQTTTALPGDAGPQWGDGTGHTLSPAGSVTQVTFWVLAGDGSRVSSCAVPLVLQVREETGLLNWLAQTWLKSLSWAGYRDLKLHTHSKKQPWELGKYYMKLAKQTHTFSCSLHFLFYQVCLNWISNWFAFLVLNGF